MNCKLLLLTAIYASSCSYLETDRLLLQDDTSSSLTNVEDYSVGYSTVKRLALQTKSDDISIIPYEENADTLFYIINSPQGWQIIANDQRATPILASGFDDRLDPASTNHNGIKVWLKAASDYVNNIKNTPMTDEKKNNIEFWKTFSEIAVRKAIFKQKTKDAFDSLNGETYRWKLTETTEQISSSSSGNIPHLISTKWGQGSPWNNKLLSQDYYDEQGVYHYSKCLTGCVAISIAQILFYWHHTFGYPNALYHTVTVNGWQPYILGTQSNLSITTSDNNTYSTRWDSMPLTASGSNCDYVGDLMITIGKKVYMYYSPLGSFSDVIYFDFGELGMDKSYSSYDYNIVSNCLDNSRPVIIEATSTNGTSGHAWIIDGKITRTYFYRTTATWQELSEDLTIGGTTPGVHYYTDEQARAIDPNVFDGKTTISYSSTSNNYLRMNWGEDGEFDNAEYSSNVNWHPVYNGIPGNPTHTYTSNATIFYNFTTQNK